MRSNEWSRPHSVLRLVRLRGWFDGGRRSDSLASCGWLIKAAYTFSPETSWCTIAWASVLLPAGTTTVDAELSGAARVTAAMCEIAKDVFKCSDFQPLLQRAKIRRIA